MEQIGLVERKLNFNLRLNADKESQIENNYKEKEIRRLKKNLLFPKIDRTEVAEYGLITGYDFRPSNVRCSIDFTYNINHKCNPSTCPNDLDMFPTKLPSIKTPTTTKSNAVMDRTLKRDWQKLCLKVDKTIKNETKLLGVLNPGNFRVTKDTIVFSNYRVNLIYKKRFQVQNISKTMQYVTIPAMEHHEFFKVQPEIDLDDNFRLSAGMSVSFIVIFKANIYLDVQVTIEVCGHKIKLISYRDAPNLSAFVLRNAFPVSQIHHDFDVSRSLALNNTIECGSCFVGEKIEALLLFKNNGGPGKFFFMTELQWYSQDIESLHNDQQLDFGSFSLQPNYFELNTDEIIVIKVDFYGATENTCVENLILVCNNITWESIDFVADVTIFDKYCVTLEKNKLITMEHFKSLLERSTSTLSQVDESVQTSEDSSVVLTVSNARPSRVRYSRVTVPSNSIDESIPSTMEKEIMAIASGHVAASDIDIIDEEILGYLLQQEKESPVCSVSSEEGVDKSQFAVYFGHSLGFKTVTQNLTVYNKSMINLKFRWSFHETNHVKFQHLNSEWVKIEGGEDNYLPAYGKVEFTIILTVGTIEPGFYALTLKLIIEDIPSCAVKFVRPHNPKFQIINRFTDEFTTETTPSVDVQVATFDVICYVDCMRITFEPQNIFGTHQPYQCGTVVKREFKLLVECNNEVDLPGKWIQTATNPVIVKPAIFNIRSGVPKIFDIEVEIEKHCNIKNQLRVCIDGFYNVYCPFTILVDSPHLNFNRCTLNFGTLIIGNTYERKFKILNSNYINVDWEIREQYKPEVDRPGKNIVDISARNLKCGDVEVTYRIRTGAEVQWISWLILCTIFKGKRIQDSKIMVVYDIIENPIYLHTNYSECPILSPQEVLYVNHSQTFKLCFHNIATTTVYYTYGEVYGRHAEHLDISIAPARIKIAEEKISRIDITITPTKSGIFDDLFVPFSFINDSPYLVGEFFPPPQTVLTVLLAVDDISVKVTLPCNKEGIAKEIIWPPQANYEFETPDESCSDDQSNNPEAVHDEQLMDDFGVDDIDILTKDLIQYLIAMDEPNLEQVVHEPSQMSTFSSDSTYAEASCPSLSEGFRNVSNYYIEICGVRIREVVKCCIKFENMTPVFGILQTDVTNFPCQLYYKKGIDSILEKLNYKKNGKSKIFKFEHKNNRLDDAYLVNVLKEYKFPTMRLDQRHHPQTCFDLVGAHQLTESQSCIVEAIVSFIKLRVHYRVFWVDCRA